METTHPTRRFPRVPAQATLLYSGGGPSGTAHLCDISHGGIGIRQPSPALTEGSEIPVTVSIGFNRIGPICARVVWSHADRAGLELDWTDPAVQSRLSQALRYLEPLR